MEDLHLHISALHALIAFLMLIPFFYFWHIIAWKNADKAWGQGMLTII